MNFIPDSQNSSLHLLQLLLRLLNGAAGIPASLLKALQMVLHKLAVCAQHPLASCCDSVCQLGCLSCQVSAQLVLHAAKSMVWKEMLCKRQQAAQAPKIVPVLCCMPSKRMT